MDFSEGLPWAAAAGRIRHTDDTGRESTMPLSGVKAQRDRNGNILINYPDSGGGLSFVVYSPQA